MSLSIFTCNNRVAFPSGASPVASIFYGHRLKVSAVVASCRNNTRTTMYIAIRTYTIQGENTERDVTTMAFETGYHKYAPHDKIQPEISHTGTTTSNKRHQTRNRNHNKGPGHRATKQAQNIGHIELQRAIPNIPTMTRSRPKYPASYHDKEPTPSNTKQKP